MNLKLVTSGAAELGIQSQYLDGELHFVDHALAGSMAAGEKLQVLDAVVSPDAVDVVDGFGIKKLSPDMLGHDVAMFQVVGRGQSINTGDNDLNVPSAVISALENPASCVLPLIRQSAKQRSAFAAAQAFVRIDGSAGLSLNGHVVSALHAFGVPRFFRHATAYAAAFCGTIQRFFAPFFNVGSQITWLHGEGFVADSAFELNRFHARCGATVDALVQGLARRCTEFLPSVGRLNCKKLSALFTVFLNRHLSFSMLGQFGIDSTEACVSK